jgi:hypothetical protein
MPSKTAVENPTYAFTAGLVTDQSPVNPVPGSAVDCFDYEIQIDGSIKRRKGIRLESGGQKRTLTDALWEGDEAFGYHMWKAAGGDASRTVVVLRIGTSLYLFEESDKFTETPPFAEVSLLSLGVLDATPTDIRTNDITMSSGRGQLLLGGRYINPVAVNLIGNTPELVPINIQMRDFSDVPDSVSIVEQPVASTDAILYNLYNRGWSANEITQYVADLSVYPAKHMLPWLGYIRVVDAGTQEGYGTREWNSAKMAAEIFGTASAPKGRLLINPFDTRTANNAVAVAGADLTTIQIVAGTLLAYGSPATFQLTTATNHGLTTPTPVSIVGTNGDTINVLASVADVDKLTFEYSITEVPTTMVGGSVSFSTTTDVSVVITKPDGYNTDERPTTVAWYAGRAWYMGTNHPKLSDLVFFSHLVEDDKDLGKCYQSNDPTGENFNAVLDTDGGVIKIPGLFGVHRAEVFGSSLVVFSDSGVWEISGGESGFSAVSYRVRKVSDNEACSQGGVVRTDSGLAFVSKRGLCMVQYDTNSGYLNVGSLTAGRLDTYWGALPDIRWQSSALAYDDAKKRIYTLIPRDGTFVAYTEALVLDLRMPEGGAYYKLRLPYEGGQYVIGALGVESGDNPNKNRKIKFVSISSTTTTETVEQEEGPDLEVTTYTGDLKVLDMDHSRFDDEFGTEKAPFWEATSDNIQDWHKHKYLTHYLCTHVKRTVTSYVSNGFDLIPVNPGSAVVQCKWNWADSGISGKFTMPQQIYRETRMFVPASPESTDGEPVLVRRHKIRGSGRSVNIRITGAVGYDSHILGWVLQYGVG